MEEISVHGSKKILVLALVVVLMMALCVPVFATEGNPYDDNPYYVVYQKNSTESVFTSTSKIYVFHTEREGWDLLVTDSSADTAYYESGNYIGKGNTDAYFGIDSTRADNQVESILYASDDIYYVDTNFNTSDVFFSKPKVTLVTATEQTDLTKVMAQIVAVVSSVLILVVSYLALRKAWAWLLTALRQA